MLIFVEMYIPSGFPRFILLFDQMLYGANDSLTNLILVGVTAFGEGWKGWGVGGKVPLEVGQCSMLQLAAS